MNIWADRMRKEKKSAGILGRFSGKSRRLSATTATTVGTLTTEDITENTSVESQRESRKTFSTRVLPKARPLMKNSIRHVHHPLPSPPSSPETTTTNSSNESGGHFKDDQHTEDKVRNCQHEEGDDDEKGEAHTSAGCKNNRSTVDNWKDNVTDSTVVRFAPKEAVVVGHVPALDQYTEEELRCIWWTDQDFERFRKSAKALVAAVVASNSNTNNNDINNINGGGGVNVIIVEDDMNSSTSHSYGRNGRSQNNHNEFSCSSAPPTSAGGVLRSLNEGYSTGQVLAVTMDEHEMYSLLRNRIPNNNGGLRSWCHETGPLRGLEHWASKKHNRCRQNAMEESRDVVLELVKYKEKDDEIAKQYQEYSRSCRIVARMLGDADQYAVQRSSASEDDDNDDSGGDGSCTFLMRRKKGFSQSRKSKKL